MPFTNYNFDKAMTTYLMDSLDEWVLNNEHELTRLFGSSFDDVKWGKPFTLPNPCTAFSIDFGHGVIYDSEKHGLSMLASAIEKTYRSPVIHANPYDVETEPYGVTLIKLLDHAIAKRVPTTAELNDVLEIKRTFYPDKGTYGTVTEECNGTSVDILVIPGGYYISHFDEGTVLKTADIVKLTDSSTSLEEAEKQLGKDSIAYESVAWLYKHNAPMDEAKRRQDQAAYIGMTLEEYDAMISSSRERNRYR